MSKRRTPAGFYLAAFCAVAFGLLMARAALRLGSLTGDDTALVRAAALLLAALSAVVAEALLAARPWAYRASLALAAAFAGVVVLDGLGDGAPGFSWAVARLIVSAIVVGPILVYVRERSADLFGTGGQPRPRPVAAAAARGRWIASPVSGVSALFAQRGPATRKPRPGRP